MYPPLANWQPYCDPEENHMKTQATPNKGIMARWKKHKSIRKKLIELMTSPITEPVILLNSL